MVRVLSRPIVANGSYEYCIECRILCIIRKQISILDNYVIDYNLQLITYFVQGQMRTIGRNSKTHCGCVSCELSLILHKTMI